MSDPPVSRNPAPTAALESAAVDPTQFPALRALTGTVDDDDAPGDEHVRENEAAARETSEDTEAPEEFGREGEESRLFNTEENAS